MIAKALPSVAVVEEIQHGDTAIHDLASRLEETARSAAEMATAVAQWDTQLDATLVATLHEQQ